MRAGIYLVDIIGVVWIGEEFIRKSVVVISPRCRGDMGRENLDRIDGIFQD
jgi:hypothetical protein